MYWILLDVDMLGVNLWLILIGTQKHLCDLLFHSSLSVTSVMTFVSYVAYTLYHYSQKELKDFKNVNSVFLFNIRVQIGIDTWTDLLIFLWKVSILSLWKVSILSFEKKCECSQYGLLVSLPTKYYCSNIPWTIS